MGETVFYRRLATGTALGKIFLGFVGLILVGAALLCLPISRQDGQSLSVIDSVFLSTSAVCLTGLTPVNVGETFSPFGQGVLMLLIQLGGLGVMTSGTLFLIVRARGLSTRGEDFIMANVGKLRTARPVDIFIYACVLVVLWEVAATVLLTHRRLADPSVTSFGQAVWESAFHSVSSFCNAGISIYPEGIERWRDDPISLMVAMILVVVGGIGLLTLVNFRYYYPWRRDRLKRGRLTLQTKICLSVTVVLLAAGGLFTLVSEWNHTLKSVGWAERLELALFHSVMTRSGGFNLVDVGEMTPKTLLGTLVLMLIGGSPGSMAGGLKVPTLVLLIASAKAALQRRTELTWSRSTLAPIQANVAVMMVLFAVAVLTIGIGALMHTELDQASSETGHRWLAIVFEAISAFATVGLSTGITGELSGPGKGVVVVLMLVGRLGPMFLALHLTRPASPPRVSFPQEELAVG